MKKRPGLLALVLVLAGLCACTRSVQPVDTSDSGIKARLEFSLHSQPELDLKYLSIDVNSGVVTLSGLVGSYEDRDKIALIARRTKGVDQVIVNLIVPE